MAEKTRKWTLNVDGEFYVDESCIDCDCCRVIAPECFTANEEGRHSYVFRQPQNAEERELCQEALRECPVEAIGNDGAATPAKA